jgi:hypothetical protein
VIVRVFRARLRQGAEPRFLATARVPTADLTGLISRLVAVRLVDRRTETLSVSVWRDWPCVHAFAGGLPERPVLSGNDLGLLEDWTIEHYEVILREDLSPTSDVGLDERDPI